MKWLQKSIYMDIIVPNYGSYSLLNKDSDISELLRDTSSTWYLVARVASAELSAIRVRRIQRNVAVKRQIWIGV